MKENDISTKHSLRHRIVGSLKSTKVIIAVFIYAVKVLLDASKIITFIFFMASILGGLTTLLELWSITKLVNELTSNSQFSDIFIWIVVLISAMVIKQLIFSIQPYMSEKLKLEVEQTLKKSFFKKAYSVKLISLETPEYYDKLQRSKRATSGMLTHSLETIGKMASNLIDFLVVVFAISQISSIYSILLLIGSIILVLSISKGNKLFNEVNYRQSPDQRKLGYFESLFLRREPAAELRLFNLSEFFLERWSTIFKSIMNELYDTRKKIARRLFTTSLGIHILIGIIALGTIVQGLKGEISLGLIVGILYLLNRFNNNIQMTGFHINELNSFYFNFRYIPEFLNEENEEEREGRILAPDAVNSIEFENVTFTYPGQSVPSLLKINLHIHRGEKIAIVGENGAGKSTLVKLLMGFYKPTEGRILVNGIDIMNIDLKSWREHIAAVFQNFVRYEFTAKENIGFGNLSNINTSELIYESSKRSGAHDIIKNLEAGYDTLLGKRFQNSHDLSVGQWQKLAITRAYFRDAQILILDEPSASLDAQAELEVYREFSNASNGKTVLLISHRLGSARLADRIIQLDKGKIIEEGTHIELMMSDGAYAKMYHLQSEWYQPIKEEM